MSIDASRSRSAGIKTGLTEADIASFKALGVSICFECDAIGEFWLVPFPTDEDRREITPQELATLLEAAWAGG